MKKRLLVSLLLVSGQLQAATIDLPFGKQLEVIDDPGAAYDPRTIVQSQYVEHSAKVLRKVIQEKDPAHLKLQVAFGHFPEVARAGDTLTISLGAFVSVSHEDELAFMLVRALEGNPPFSDSKATKRVLDRFVHHTPYNPMASVVYFERMIKLLEAFESYGSKELFGSDGTLYTNEQMRIQRELAKARIEEAAWSEINLADRIEKFTELSDSAATSGAKKLLYLAYLHYHFGPDYARYVRWNQEHPILIVGPLASAALIAGWKIFRGGSQVVLGTANAITQGVVKGVVKLSKKQPSQKVVIAIAIIDIIGVSAIAFAGCKYAFDWYFATPPDVLKGDYEALKQLNKRLDEKKGHRISEKEFRALIDELSKFKLGKRLAGILEGDLEAVDRDYWLGKGVLSAYEKAVNLAIASEIRLSPSTPLFLRKSHFRVIEYPLLKKFSTLVGYEGLLQDQRLPSYQRDRLKGPGYDREIDVLAVAITMRFLTEFRSAPDPHRELKRAATFMGQVAFETRQYQDTLADSAARHCATYFVQDVEDEMGSLVTQLKDRKEKNKLESINRCLATEIARHENYADVIRQFNFLKRYFAEDEKTIFVASQKLRAFVRQVKDIRAFIEDLDGLRHEGKRFGSHTPSFFELATANGETLLEIPHLIKGMDDVFAVIEAPYFWPYMKSDSSNLNAAASGLLFQIKKASNGYNIELTESLHGLLLKKVRTFAPHMQNSDKLALWKKMVKRGTSVHSDELFWEMHEIAQGEELVQLEELALDGLLHNQEMKKQLVLRKVFASGAFKSALSGDAGSRNAVLQKVIRLALKALGLSVAFAELMERISNEMLTSEEESSLVEKSKFHADDVSREVRDDGLDLLTAIIGEARNWSKERQWDFILFLVGHQDLMQQPSKNFLLKLSLTPLRLRDLFNALPSQYQYKTVDALLSQQNGLLETVDPGARWTRVVIDHLLAMVHEDAREIVEELVASYLEALNTPGLSYFKSTVFAHLLVSSKKGTKSSDVLAEACKHFGAFGIKIGQFLLATGILPAEENKALLDLEDSARAPTRERVYQDLREIFAGQAIPYVIQDVVGGASLKYVVRAKKNDGTPVVLKILSKDAHIHSHLEEKLLKSMAENLVRKHGAKYAIFKSAVYASADAIRREINFEREVLNTELARQSMYRSCGNGVSFTLVRDVLVHERLIESEYAAGGNIHRINDNSKQKLASAIVDCEVKNFFQETGDIYFDPDRHSGNYRVQNETVYPIDFGQLHVLTQSEKARLIEVAAIAGIFSQMGKHGRLATKVMGRPFVARLFELFKEKAEPALSKKEELLGILAQTFSLYPSEEGLTPYYRLISAMEEAGLLTERARMLCYDIPKGILQISRLGPLVKQHNDSQVTLEEMFKAQVEAKAFSLWQEFGHEASFGEILREAIGVVIPKVREENL